MSIARVDLSRYPGTYPGTDPRLRHAGACLKSVPYSRYGRLAIPAARVIALVILLCCLGGLSKWAVAGEVRVAALKFGSVSWELAVMEHHNLARRHGFSLEVVELASNNALNVSLQGGRVDIVVGDWIWVSRQRHAGRDYTSWPYSLSDGLLLVDPASGIEEFADLRGRRLGVAGDEVNKNWLILRAFGAGALGEDTAEFVTPAFAAPPLLSELMLMGELPAVLNFWHYGTRLQVAGMKLLLTTDEMLQGIGIKETIPLLVWIFRESWARDNPDLAKGFLDASHAAKRILADSDAEWERIRPLTRVSMDRELEALRGAFRAGIPKRFGAAEIAASGDLFKVLAELGGRQLTGGSSALNPGTFYSYEIPDHP